MRLNRAGFFLGGIYAVYFGMISGVGIVAGDPTRMIFGAMAAVPAHLLLGLLKAVMGDPDFPVSPGSALDSNYLYVPLSLVLFYLLGWALSAIGRLLIRLFGNRLRRMDDRLIDYIDRKT